MSLAAELAALFQRDLTRVIQQIEAIPHDQDLWRVEQGISNPAGNLVLHLEGNLRTYVGQGLGGIPFARDREWEFSARGLPRAALIERMADLRELVVNSIAKLSEADLESDFPENVLGAPLTQRMFLIHLHGHLNYHLGQIDYLRRMLTGQAAIALAGL